MIHDERPVVLNRGIYKKTATTADAVFMITGMTIGAGVLGLPYAIAQAGLILGICYIILLGLIMLSLNLMIGEVALRTDESLQLPGLAGKYLGSWAKITLSTTLLLTSFGVLLAYLIGEGESLAALFGGSSIWWTAVFWCVGSFLIWGGLQRVKVAEKIISSVVIIAVVVLSLLLLPHFNPVNLYYFNSAKLFLPFGVILFALHATPAIGEARALVTTPANFRRALIIGTLIPITIYCLFVFAVVGLQGLNTTEVVTIGLGQRFGQIAGIVANIFAVLAMSTCFMGYGTALKEILEWDHKWPQNLAKLVVIGVPLALYVLGFRSFITILDVVGGLFIGIIAIIMAAVYLVARKNGPLAPSDGSFRHPWVVALPVLIFFSILVVFNFYTLLIK